MSENRYRLYGVVSIVLMVSAIAAVIADYRQMFTPVVWATVQAERSGLLMDPGADVTLRGVTVGRVRAVHAVSNGAVLDIALDPTQVGRIPSNVNAEILAPTIFGTKYVDLVPPARPSPAPIATGAVIEPTETSTEIDDVFADTVSLLTSVDAAKLNASLGALSTGLQGNGARIGQLIEQLNTYLAGLQPSMPALGRDVSQLGKVSQLYAEVSPDLLTVASNLTATGQTLVDKQMAVQAFLVDLTGLAYKTRSFLADNQHGLSSSLTNLAPVTALTARYSPMFPCLLAGINQLRRTEEPAVGGAQPGMHILTSLLPGEQGYQMPKDLPIVGATNGPSCYGGPLSANSPPAPHVRFNDGSNTYTPTYDGLSVGRTPLALQLFGPLTQGVPPRRVGQ